MRFRTKDPASLFRCAVDLNLAARDLREDGWTVRLSLSESGQVEVAVSVSRSCEPAKDEGEVR